MLLSIHNVKSPNIEDFLIFVTPIMSRKVRLLIRHPRYYHFSKQKRSKQLDQTVGLVIKARSNCICRLERYLPFRWSSFCFARQDQLRYLSGLGRTTLGKRIEFEPLYLPMEKEGKFYMESSLFLTVTG